MLAKTKGIVLHVIPCKDRYAVVNMYTETFGEVSYWVVRPHNKKLMKTQALFIPLTVLDLEVEHQNKCDMYKIIESHRTFPMQNMIVNPVKSSVALFLSEVLTRVMRDRVSDPPLFKYLYDSIFLLENLEEGVANFHIVFLLGLLRHLGVFPNVGKFQFGYYLDMLNGEFTNKLPTHRYFLDQTESAFFSRLLRIRFDNMSLFKFSRQERMRIVQRILEYYRLHLPDFPEIKSLPVLQALFD